MIFVLILTFIVKGQAVSKFDSLKIVSATEKVFKVFENPNLKDFENISSTQIYCLICEEKNNSRHVPYIISRDDFFNFYIDSIYNLWLPVNPALSLQAR